MPKAHYFSIGLVAPKYGEDLEIMFKAAHTFGADSIFLLQNNWTSLHNPGKRERKAEHYPPYIYYPTVAEFEREHLKSTTPTWCL